MRGGDYTESMCGLVLLALLAAASPPASAPAPAPAPEPDLDWKAGLESPDPIVRRRAAEWAATRAEAAEALPRLVRLVREDKDWNVRTLAARGLGTLKSRSAVPDLVAALKDGHWGVRYAALRSLVRIEDPRAVPAILALSTDPEGAVRESIPECLESFGEKAAEVLHEGLASQASAVRFVCFDVLGRLGKKDLAPPGMVSKNQHGQVVRYDASGLPRVSDRRAILALRGALLDAGVDVRREAARAFGRIRDAGTVPDLVRASKDPDAGVREAALIALRDIADPSALPRLLEAMRDPDPALSRRAHEAIDRIGPPARNALLESFAGTDRAARLEAARALARTGPAIVPDLAPLIAPPPGRAALDAALAILRAGGEDARAAVLKRYPNADPELQAAFLAFLEDWTGEAFDPAKPPSPKSVFDHFAKEGFLRTGRGGTAEHWLASLRSDDVRVRRAGAAAIRNARDLRALEELSKALESDDVPLRRAAAWAIASLEDDSAADALAKALADTDPIVRLAAAQGLFGNPNANGGALAIALEDKSMLVRFAAAGTLARLPSPPPEAAEAVEKALAACPAEWTALKAALEEARGILAVAKKP